MPSIDYQSIQPTYGSGLLQVQCPPATQYGFHADYIKELQKAMQAQQDLMKPKESPLTGSIYTGVVIVTRPTLIGGATIQNSYIAYESKAAFMANSADLARAKLIAAAFAAGYTEAPGDVVEIKLATYA